MFVTRLNRMARLTIMLGLLLTTVGTGVAADCEAMLERFNHAIDEGRT